MQGKADEDQNQASSNKHDPVCLLLCLQVIVAVLFVLADLVSVELERWLQ